MTGFEDIDKRLALLKENKKEYKEAWGYDDYLEEFRWHKESRYHVCFDCTAEEFEINKLEKIAELKLEMRQIFDGYFSTIEKEMKRLRLEEKRRLSTSGGREYIQHARALKDKSTSMGVRVIIRNKMDELSTQWRMTAY